MVKNPRKGMVLGAAGLVAGVALGAMGMMSLRGGDGPYASSPPATRSMGAASAPAPASTFVTAVSVNCELAPVLANGAEGDGQVALQAKPAAASGSEVASLILSGKEAAAAGRQRDAEVYFLNACRNAAVLQEGDGVPLSDAMYQLGRHYATVAAFGAPKGKELLQRAERLYSASLEGYRSRLGPTHEKTKFAQEGLITVRQGTGSTVTANAVPAAPAPVTPVPAAEAPPAAPTGPAPAPDPAPVAAAPSPPPAPVAKPAAAPAPAPAKPAAAATPPAAASAAAPASSQPAAPKPASAASARPEAKNPAPATEQPQPRPRRVVPSRTATADASPEITPGPPARPRPPSVPPDVEPDDVPPPPRSSAMGASPGEAPTAEGSAGSTE